MARAVWSGSISFGLVNVPVKAYTAVHDHAVHFHQLEKGTGARIRNRKVSEKSGKEVEGADIELGYEFTKGRYVTVDPDEIAALRPRTTRTIDIADFVAVEEIDPVYYEHTYWLAPDGEAANRPYRLLLAAMEEQQRVAIGTVVMRTKQYLAAIRPMDGALAMSTMRFADEVVPRKDIDGLDLGRAKPDDRELRLASQIVESLSGEWDPTRYHDTFTEEVVDLLERKAKGEELAAEPEPEPAAGKVVDLMAALQASVDAARGRKKEPAKKAKRKSPARKSPATKAKKKAPARRSA